MIGRCALALLLSSGVALAEPAKPDAVAHHDRAAKLYDLQQFDDAAKEYQIAYEINGNPNELYNIAQAQRMGGQTEKALGSYRAFLRRAPSVPVAAHVRKLIPELEAKLKAEQEAAQQRKRDAEREERARREAEERAAARTREGAAPASSPPPALPRGGRGMTIAGFTLLGVGVASVAVGGAMVGLAKRDDDRYAHPTAGQAYDPALPARRDAEQRAAIGLFAAGGALAVSGIVLGVVGLKRWRAASAVRADAGSLSLRF